MGMLPVKIILISLQYFRSTKKHCWYTLVMLPLSGPRNEVYRHKDSLCQRGNVETIQFLECKGKPRYSAGLYKKNVPI